MGFGVNDIKKQGLLHYSMASGHTKPSLQLVAPIVSLEQNVFFYQFLYVSLQNTLFRGEYPKLKTGGYICSVQNNMK
jgi:hypothetical protein